MMMDRHGTPINGIATESDASGHTSAPALCSNHHYRLTLAMGSMMFLICSYHPADSRDAALPLVRGRPFAQSGKGDADVRSRRGKCFRPAAMAADRWQAGVPAL